MRAALSTRAAFRQRIRGQRSPGCNPVAFLSAPGTIVNAQWWGRDSTTTGSFLSDAVQCTICS